MPDRYSNPFLNACINCHVYAEYLKMIEFYSPFGMRHVFLYSINTNKNDVFLTRNKFALIHGSLMRMCNKMIIKAGLFQQYLLCLVL